MFTQTGEYALRAATFIGKQPGDKLVSAKEIAANTKVSLKYLQKVLRDLVQADVLSSTRGIGGGFRLSRLADQMPLTDIVRPFDTSLRRIECPFGNLYCGQETPCPVHNRWINVVTAYKNFLENTTVADVIATGVHLPQAVTFSPR